MRSLGPFLLILSGLCAITPRLLALASSTNPSLNFILIVMSIILFFLSLYLIGKHTLPKEDVTEYHNK